MNKSRGLDETPPSWTLRYINSNWWTAFISAHSMFNYMYYWLGKVLVAMVMDFIIADHMLPGKQPQTAAVMTPLNFSDIDPLGIYSL